MKNDINERKPSPEIPRNDGTVSVENIEKNENLTKPEQKKSEPIFSGLTICLQGFAKKYTHKVTQLLKSNGASLVVSIPFPTETQQHNHVDTASKVNQPLKVVDYLIAPFTFNQYNCECHDHKKVVSEYWFEYCLSEKTLFPITSPRLPPVVCLPMSANLKLPFSSLKGALICVSMFTGLERLQIGRLIQAVGAVNRERFTRDCSILLLKELTGKKYEKALEWDIPCVTSTWLFDCLKEGHALNLALYSSNPKSSVGSNRSTSASHVSNNNNNNNNSNNNVSRHLDMSPVLKKALHSENHIGSPLNDQNIKLGNNNHNNSNNNNGTNKHNNDHISENDKQDKDASDLKRSLPASKVSISGANDSTLRGTLDIRKNHSTSNEEASFNFDDVSMLRTPSCNKQHKLVTQKTSMPILTTPTTIPQTTTTPIAGRALTTTLASPDVSSISKFSPRRNFKLPLGGVPHSTPKAKLSMQQQQQQSKRLAKASSTPLVTAPTEPREFVTPSPVRPFQSSTPNPRPRTRSAVAAARTASSNLSNMSTIKKLPTTKNYKTSPSPAASPATKRSSQSQWTSFGGDTIGAGFERKRRRINSTADDDRMNWWFDNCDQSVERNVILKGLKIYVSERIRDAIGGGEWAHLITRMGGTCLWVYHESCTHVIDHQLCDSLLASPTSKVPVTLEVSLVSLGSRPIVSGEWLRQCYINRKIVPVENYPRQQIVGKPGKSDGILVAFHEIDSKNREKTQKSNAFYLEESNSNKGSNDANENDDHNNNNDKNDLDNGLNINDNSNNDDESIAETLEKLMTVIQPQNKPKRRRRRDNGSFKMQDKRMLMDDEGINNEHENHSHNNGNDNDNDNHENSHNHNVNNKKAENDIDDDERNAKNKKNKGDGNSKNDNSTNNKNQQQKQQQQQHNLRSRHYMQQHHQDHDCHEHTYVEEDEDGLQRAYASSYQTGSVTYGDSLGSIQREKLKAKFSNGKNEFVFALSGMSVTEKPGYFKIIERLDNVQVLDGNFHDVRCTHLIVAIPSQSEKYYGALASAQWILHPSYIHACGREGRVLDPEPYQWSKKHIDSLPLEAKKKMSMYNSVAAIPYWRDKLIDKRTSKPERGAFEDWKVLLCQEYRGLGGMVRLLKAGRAEIIAIQDPKTDVTFTAEEISKANIAIFNYELVNKNEWVQNSLNRCQDQELQCFPTHYIADFLLLNRMDTAKRQRQQLQLPKTTPLRPPRRGPRRQSYNQVG